MFLKSLEGHDLSSGAMTLLAKLAANKGIKSIN